MIKKEKTSPVYPLIFLVFHLLLGVNFLSFSLPPDSGERITLVITSLLTMTVFMLLVAEIMPPVSDVVPIISIYYATAMFVVKFLQILLGPVVQRPIYNKLILV